MLTEILDPTQDALFSLTEQSVTSSLYITGAKSQARMGKWVLRDQETETET